MRIENVTTASTSALIEALVETALVFDALGIGAHPTFALMTTTDVQAERDLLRAEIDRRIPASHAIGHDNIALGPK